MPVSDRLFLLKPQNNEPQTRDSITGHYRFITGQVESDRRGSMFDYARRIGLPESFVELRHQAIHDDFPALLVFRQAATRSLHWLWEHYWKHIDVPSTAPDDQDPRQLKKLFRSYLQEYSDRPPRSSQESIRKACLDCVHTCKGNDATIRLLADVLLEPGFLMNTDKK